MNQMNDERVVKKMKSESLGNERDSDESNDSPIFHVDGTKPNLDESIDDLLNNPFMARALEVITLKIDFNLGDGFINRPFKPLMAHQIFGQDELISGYRNLQVLLLFLPNSFNVKIEITHEEKHENILRGEIADDIVLKLSDWFPHMVTDVQRFKTLKEKEDLEKVFGLNIATFSLKDDIQIAIHHCKVSEEGFVNFHERFQGLIVFYIDAASVIDCQDPNWVFFYVYHKIKLENSNTIYLPIGYCTVYKFTMAQRARIAQLFILPNYQMKGIGTKVLKEIYTFYKPIEEIQYITVESPCPEFTIMRDKLDLRILLHDNTFAKRNILKGYSLKMEKVAQKLSKICAAQVKHLYYILLCFFSQDSEERYSRFINYMKKEIHLTYKRKLNRMNSNIKKEEKILKIKQIVGENCLTSRRIHRDMKIFVRSIRPQLLFLEKLCN